MKIGQMSDMHVGSGLFRPELLSSAIEETNSLRPDLVAIVGDLTTEGYRWEFEEARAYLDRITCPNVVYAMGTTTSGAWATGISRISSGCARGRSSSRSRRARRRS